MLPHFRCLGLMLCCLIAWRASNAEAEEPGRLIYESEPTVKHEFVTKFLGGAMLPLNSAQELYVIGYKLRPETVEQASKPDSTSNQVTIRSSGRGLSKKLRERRARDLAHLEQHQAALRELESLGYVVKYEQCEDWQTQLPAVVITSAAGYIRNSVSDKLEVPVWEIQPRRAVLFNYTYTFDRKDHRYNTKANSKLDQLAIEQLLPFTQLRILNITNAKFTLEEIEQLQVFPQLEKLFLPEEMLKPEQRAKIQQLLPRCELLSEGDAHLGGW